MDKLSTDFTQSPGSVALKNGLNIRETKSRVGDTPYSIVYKGYGSNGEKVAVKRLDRIGRNEKGEEALRRLNHPNVVKLLRVEEEKGFR